MEAGHDWLGHRGFPYKVAGPISLGSGTPAKTSQSIVTDVYCFLDHEACPITQTDLR